jgi:hypothetical protein
MSIIKFNLAKFECALAFQVVDIDIVEPKEFVYDNLRILVGNNKSLLTITPRLSLLLPLKQNNNQNTSIVYFDTNEKRDDVYEQVINGLYEFTKSLQ